MTYEPDTIEYSLPGDLVAEDSPILIQYAELHKKAVSDVACIQLKICNFSRRKIRDMKLELVLDPSGAIVENRLQKLIPVGSSELWEIPVPAGSKTFSLKRIGVIFEDQSFWVGHGTSFCAFPIQKLISEKEKDLSLFREKTTEQSQYVPIEYRGFWRCSCGQINNRKYCSQCGVEKDRLITTYLNCDVTVTCPKCGKSIVEGMGFCPYCGEELEEWKYHTEERRRDEKSFQERLRDFISTVQEHTPATLRRPWWFWMVLLLALVIGAATMYSIGHSGAQGQKSADVMVSEALDTPMDQLKRKAYEQAEVEFGSGEYEIIVDEDKKIFYVNGWPDKAYADLNRARVNEKEGAMQWTLWRDTVQTNCETLREYMDEKGYDDWGCSWSIRSNRNHGTVFLTVFDGNVLYDELEYQK